MYSRFDRDPEPTNYVYIRGVADRMPTTELERAYLRSVPGTLWHGVVNRTLRARGRITFLLSSRKS